MRHGSIFFRKIEAAGAGEPGASYGGIALRSLWFWVVCFGGMALYLWAPMGAPPSALLIASVIAAVLCPILVYAFPQASPVLGTLYSFLQGFLLAMICTAYAPRYARVIYWAVGITVLVFFIALLAYRTSLIKVDQRLRGVVWILLITTIISSGIVYISSFFTTTLKSIFWAHGPVVLLVSIVALLIATVNLVFEFDFATGLVQRGIHKRYEWIAAYGLFMTVITIFLRLLQLLSRVNTGKGETMKRKVAAVTAIVIALGTGVAIKLRKKRNG